MNAVSVRPYRADDAPALAAIFRASVETLTVREYSAVQRRTWMAHGPTAERLASAYADGRVALVAEADGAPAGFSDVEADGHIGFLYVAPFAARRGVARALLCAVEEAALAQGIARLYAEASETALPAFLACGFVHVARRDFEVAGVAVHNHAVEKRLPAAPPPV